jgi:hypothetical protein
MRHSDSSYRRVLTFLLRPTDSSQGFKRGLDEAEDRLSHPILCLSYLLTSVVGLVPDLSSRTTARP